MDQLIADGPRIQQWMHERSRLPLTKEFHGIARELDGKIVSAFGFDHFQDTGCSFHAVNDHPQGFSRGLLIKAFEVPFHQWNYQYLAGIIGTGNVKSLNLAKRLGFVQVGEIPDHLWMGVLYKDKCRWLKLAERAK